MQVLDDANAELWLCRLADDHSKQVRIKQDEENLQNIRHGIDSDFYAVRLNTCK